VNVAAPVKRHGSGRPENIAAVDDLVQSQEDVQQIDSM